MYGLVNQAVRDLVIKVAGADAWDRIRKDAGLGIDNFVAMDSYADEITYALVACASKVLRMDAPSILRAFGKHWILYTASEGYGSLMDMFGADYFDALRNINQLHSRIGLSMPHLNAPKFVIRQVSQESLSVEYISIRKGLAPMMLGLLEGLAEKHGSKVTIEHRAPNLNHNHDIFIVTRAL